MQMKSTAMAVACVVLLAGCTTTQQGTTSPGQEHPFQQATASLCQFLPTADTIRKLLGLNDPALSTATEVASAICSAIKFDPNAPASPGGQANIKGVVIEGSYQR
jgi:hypothetical protein